MKGRLVLLMAIILFCIAIVVSLKSVGPIRVSVGTQEVPPFLW